MQPTSSPRSSARRSRSASCSAAPRLDRLGLGDERADDVRLPSGLEVTAEARVGVRTPILGDPGGDDGLAARGRLGDLAHLEVAVDGQGKRARDRRRRHVQDVRGAALGQGLALLDPEPVLLVHDGDGQIAELDRLLDQRVRAYRDVRVAGGDRRARGRVLGRRERARQQDATDVELPQEVLDREQVLLGERLGRRHQRALAARLDGAEECVQRHHRLARADVALEQALHRPLAAEVGIELRDRALLVAREPERQRRPVALDQRAGSAQRPRTQLFTPPAASEQADLEREQLVERQPAAAELGLFRRARTVQGPQRVRDQREPPSRLHVRRDRIGPVTGMRQHGRDHLAKLLDRDLLARRVHGREVRSLGHAVEVVRLDRELAAPELAAQADVGSRLQLLRQPRLVEPDGRDLTAPVAHPRLHEREPSARPLHRRAAHRARDRHLLAREQAGDRPVRHGHLVPARPVSQGVVHGPQPEAREATG